ncbi:MAG: Imm51 family immunity protein [Collimonas sp.]|uniref:Imm51 family immunity protein n=1 Tax=Collimonas sp. TaxID=1963772 RepID=UPI003265B697
MEPALETPFNQISHMAIKVGEKVEVNLVTDSTTFMPFILIDGHCRALVMFDHYMAEKMHVFAERAGEGWSGNGDDWTSFAQILVVEKLFLSTEQVTYDSDADMFSARGTRSILEKLGFELQAIFKNDDAIRNLMSRVKVNL